jgi:hypothetical protein
MSIKQVCGTVNSHYHLLTFSSTAGFDEPPRAPRQPSHFWRHIGVLRWVELDKDDVDWPLPSLFQPFEEDWQYRSLFEFIIELLSSNQPLPCVALPDGLLRPSSNIGILSSFNSDQKRYMAWYLASQVLLIREFFQDE